jgi:hypothetical protein
MFKYLVSECNQSTIGCRAASVWQFLILRGVRQSEHMLRRVMSLSSFNSFKTIACRSVASRDALPVDAIKRQFNVLFGERNHI